MQCENLFTTFTTNFAPYWVSGYLGATRYMGATQQICLIFLVVLLLANASYFNFLIVPISTNPILFLLLVSYFYSWDAKNICVMMRMLHWQGSKLLLLLIIQWHQNFFVEGSFTG